MLSIFSQIFFLKGEDVRWTETVSLRQAFGARDLSRSNHPGRDMGRTFLEGRIVRDQIPSPNWSSSPKLNDSRCWQWQHNVLNTFTVLSITLYCLILKNRPLG
jgi:hypothetical protein